MKLSGVERRLLTTHLLRDSKGDEVTNFSASISVIGQFRASKKRLPISSSVL